MPLERIAGDSFELGELAPETTYEIQWQTAVIAFTTGDFALEASRELSDDVLLTRNPAEIDDCPIVPSQGCFDTGPPTRVHLTAGYSRVWLIERLRCDGSSSTMVWPAECGPPVLEDYDRIVCSRVRGSDGSDLTDASDVICSVPNASLDSIPRNSSCRGAWPLDGATTLAGDDGITIGTLSGPEKEHEDGEGEGAPSETSAPPAGTAMPAATSDADPTMGSASLTPTTAMTEAASASSSGCDMAPHRALGGVPWVWLAGLCAGILRSRASLRRATRRRVDGAPSES